ncbi:MAG: CehA/McbA family metallohydrolase [Chloroflexi bacterium]|nr:CehA/McbA family metallohydrolase [Chloroflexota bacterium]
MHEIIGNIHLHTTYSDGTGTHEEVAAAAVAAGLDFLVVTDHNVLVEEVDGYYKTPQGQVLLLTGEEVHDVRREPQCNHCLVIGAQGEMATHAPNPQQLINEVQRAGGYTFLAHPHDPPATAVHEQDYAWYDWDIEGFTGLELWNYMSNFKKPLTSKLNALRAALHPERYIDQPPPATLAKWDELLTRGKRVAVVGGSDGHAITYQMGPMRRTLFPYEYMFRCVNTHLLLDEPLTGELAKDKPTLFKAIGNGRGWVGYDLPHPTRGFRFSGQSKTKGVMGDDVLMDAGATLQILTPAKCYIRLIHNGQIIASADNDIRLTHIPIETGAYRVECYIPFEGQLRGWIFTNPIYLV